MIGTPRQVAVYALAAPTDMRKQFDSLAALVTHALGRDVLSGELFLFVSRGRRKAKVPFYDGTGLCVLAKRLARGHFTAPRLAGTHGPRVLTPSELALFLEGSVLAGAVPLSPPPVGRAPAVTPAMSGARVDS